LVVGWTAVADPSSADERGIGGERASAGGVQRAARSSTSAAIDGLLARVDRILYGTTGGKKVHLARALRGRAVVLMNCFDEASPLPAVLPDEDAAGRLAADTLLGVGHSDRIWLVGETLSSIELRTSTSAAAPWRSCSTTARHRARTPCPCRSTRALDRSSTRLRLLLDRGVRTVTGRQRAERMVCCAGRSPTDRAAEAGGHRPGAGRGGPLRTSTKK